MAIVNSVLASKGKKNVYDVLAGLGVRDAKNKIFDYVWEVPTGAPIFTIWAELVHADEATGRWFFVDTMNTLTLLGGGERDEQQQQRARHRLAQLARVKAGEEFIAILQTNTRSLDELKRNLTAKPLDRVKDPEHWRVARWDGDRQRVVLVRGSRDWNPTDSEVDLHLTRLGLLGGSHFPGKPEESLVSPPISQPPPQFHIGFPDQEHRDQVEAASMKFMIEHYQRLGFASNDVSVENRGYDIEVRDKSGAVVHMVEVKGTSSALPGFFLSRNERRCAESEPKWLLAVVTDALSTPRLHLYSASEMEVHFSFDPLVWRCDARSM